MRKVWIKGGTGMASKDAIGCINKKQGLNFSARARAIASAGAARRRASALAQEPNIILDAKAAVDFIVKEDKVIEAQENSFSSCLF